MSGTNKDLLKAANAAIVRGDIETFLSHCSDDIVWVTVGQPPISGKAALREWMRVEYAEPPEFSVERMIEEGPWVVALGSITVKSADGNSSVHQYSDVWRCEGGKLAELRAFVMKPSA
ncbi:nuclear transport factor 2 family protein [Roseateles terrae]|uniref:Ketosteroid isomerase-like protein n=1 Tax=Roseateles terrae TaxID=431060 RepID=A0ABR6GNZ5_9BURK|nr:nuclear transport factor 2 family protein [Roseateles terrae]MBB3193826.1 ketosteroid isomerase-like protein [Roseateles terrae]OWQ89033.1 ketosteroid isomerase [Roseateles terrae]